MACIGDDDGDDDDYGKTTLKVPFDASGATSPYFCFQ